MTVSAEQLEPARPFDCNSSMAQSEPSAEETTRKALDELRLSIDDDRQAILKNGSPINGINGKTPSLVSPRSSGELPGHDKAALLQRELEKCRQEKDALATQYQNLVSRLNSMRTTLGNKLKQDGVRVSIVCSVRVTLSCCDIGRT